MDFSHINTWLYGIFGMLVAGVLYLLRTIFTNQKQIELLQQRIELQEVYSRHRDSNLDTQLKEIRTDIKSMMNRDRKVDHNL